MTLSLEARLKIFDLMRRLYSHHLLPDQSGDLISEFISKQIHETGKAVIRSSAEILRDPETGGIAIQMSIGLTESIKIKGIPEFVQSDDLGPLFVSTTANELHAEQRAGGVGEQQQIHESKMGDQQPGLGNLDAV